MESFDVLAAGGGTAAIVEQFWRTERSRRLLLIKTLIDTVRATPDLLGPLPAVACAEEVLYRAESVTPGALDGVLMHPQVGNWAAYSLRRQRGGASGTLPLWADFGVLHVLALLAASRAGLTWRGRVPVRDGAVMLPALGMVHFPDRTGLAVAEVETRDGRITVRLDDRSVTVPDDSTVECAGWWPLRRVRAAGNHDLTLWLDDLDPYRDLADPVPPERLSADAAGRWADLVRDAWTLLCRDHPEHAEPLAAGVVSLVPLAADDGWGTRSASTGEAFGSVLLSPPGDAVTTAVSLVHEFQHIKLGALIHLLPLTGDDDALYYAPWRDDPRPLSGLVQGVYAFFGIAGFWRRRWQVDTGPAGARAAFEYAYARTQTLEALRQLDRAAGLTRYGRAVVDGLGAETETWRRDPVPDAVSTLAVLTADSHRTGWRLRHFVPAADEVTTLIAAWTGGVVPPGVSPPVLRQHPRLWWHQRVPVLVRHHVEGLATDAPEAGAADAALVAGDPVTARDGYLSLLERRPAPADGRPERQDDEDTVAAWTGLALAVARTGQTRAARVLAARPDLVAAVHAGLAAAGHRTDPVDLAAWLADAPGAAEPVRVPVVA